jgi:hypothetical protein
VPLLPLVRAQAAVLLLLPARVQAAVPLLLPARAQAAVLLLRLRKAQASAVQAAASKCMPCCRLALAWTLLLARVLVKARLMGRLLHRR